MINRLMICAVALMFVAGLTAATPKDDAKAGSWSGVIVDNMCGAKDATSDKSACTKKCVAEHGAKLALYNTADKKVYELEPQDKATGHEGHSVTVKGTVDGGGKIHITSLTMN
jgi:hypothetical protein